MIDTKNIRRTDSTALQTDHYELTMLQAALADGTAHCAAVFEVFARKLPAGRQYGVFGGLGRLLDAIEDFQFGEAELSYLRSRGFVNEATLEYLAGYRFRGDVVAYREGELYFPYSPVATFEGVFADVLLETLVLSILNHDTAVASAAARMVDAAEGHSLMEMGGRRTHDEAAIAAARVAYMVGFDASSNLEAGRRYGVPTRGTSAHAFTLAHRDERSAFASQLDALGVGTTLLVDTYDIPTAIDTAVELCRERGATGPGGIRIDSGDLNEETRAARRQLDELGATSTKIVVSGDLDEYLIEELVAVAAPIDSYGVGTKLVTGSGHPTANFVYKLVAVGDPDNPHGPLRSVAKKSAAKISIGGRKRAWRLLDSQGRAYEEQVVARNTPFTADSGEDALGRGLQVIAVKGGERRNNPSLAEIRAHHQGALAELRPGCRSTIAGHPALDGAPK